MEEKINKKNWKYDEWNAHPDLEEKNISSFSFIDVAISHISIEKFF